MTNGEYLESLPEEESSKIIKEVVKTLVDSVPKGTVVSVPDMVVAWYFHEREVGNERP